MNNSEFNFLLGFELADVSFIYDKDKMLFELILHYMQHKKTIQFAASASLLAFSNQTLNPDMVTESLTRFFHENEYSNLAPDEKVKDVAVAVQVLNDYITLEKWRKVNHSEFFKKAIQDLEKMTTVMSNIPRNGRKLMQQTIAQKYFDHLLYVFKSTQLTEDFKTTILEYPNASNLTENLAAFALKNNEYQESIVSVVKRFYQILNVSPEQQALTWKKMAQNLYEGGLQTLTPAVGIVNGVLMYTMPNSFMHWAVGGLYAVLIGQANAGQLKQIATRR